MKRLWIILPLSIFLGAQSNNFFKIPVIDRIAGRISLRILQLDVIVETKTKDDVFVKLKVSVQYKVVQENVYDAFYKLDFPQDQITSYVFDVVRAVVPKMKLDDVFEKKFTTSEYPWS